jgi:FixJ family two-component response regulator
MIDGPSVSAPRGIGISLVEGDPDVRHARQLMLRAERYDVRSYATSAALLADPRSRDYPCMIVDLEPAGADVAAMLRAMRASGWRGKAILLGGADTDGAAYDAAARHGDRMLPRATGERTLLTAIDASVDRGWGSWNANG